jgi:hypothetical protein
MQLRSPWAQPGAAGGCAEVVLACAGCGGALSAAVVAALGRLVAGALAGLLLRLLRLLLLPARDRSALLVTDPIAGIVAAGAGGAGGSISLVVSCL